MSGTGRGSRPRLHIGDGSRLKAEGYGGHPVRLRVHRRRPGDLAARPRTADFTVGTHPTLTSAESAPGGVLPARRVS